MSAAGRIRVMVVDDHPIMRNGLRDTLEASGRFEVVGEAGDGEEAVRTVAALNPEVIVMDVIMPVKDGIDACREIMELLPDMRIMILTASTEEDAVIEAIAAGATGYLQKYSRPEALVDAVLDVAEGRLRIPDQAVRRVFAMIRGQRKPVSRKPSDRLTALERETPDAVRQRQVLRRDRQGEGQQHRDHPEHPLPHTEQAGRRNQTGTRGLGRAERPAG